MVDSYVLKTEALCWLRFGKKLFHVCTEGGHWNADVLGVGPKHSVEVEIKVSKQDLWREFTTKAHKHYLYAQAEDKSVIHAPNYFYFYVPANLEAEAIKACEQHCPKAGVAVYDETGGMDGKNTRVARRPTKLHDREPSGAMRETVLRRMSSELCGRYVAQREYHHDVLDRLYKIDIRLVDLMKKMSETPDHEEVPDAAPAP